MLLWILLFAAGILIPSGKARETLGWKPAALPEEKIGLLEARLAKVDGKAGTSAGNSAVGPTSPAQLPPLQEDVLAPPADPAPTQGINPLATTDRQPRPKLPAFLVAAIAFIPINVALLCVIAGFIGGCSVSEELIRDVKMDLDSNIGSTTGSPAKRRLNFLTEHPAFSAIRGLVVFLLISSGLFVFAGSELLIESGSQEEALGNYIKFAGIFSFFAYFAGHDPTVFSAMLRFGGNRLATEKHPS